MSTQEEGGREGGGGGGRKGEIEWRMEYKGERLIDISIAYHLKSHDKTGHVLSHRMGSLFLCSCYAYDV